MRRKDRQITERAELELLLSEAKVCRLAMATGEAPYIVALSYGYAWEEELELFFHCAREGRKLDLLRRDPRVGFQIEGPCEPIVGPEACDWGMRYRSIVGTGTLEELDDPAFKARALDRIMFQHGFEGNPRYNPATLAAPAVLRLRVKELCGKQRT
ncbi:MAG TPA: pyridoxamine 5'-phosphate oxidase family protein [Rectinemataceae bacterium]|nr:pyridoxamine 5'-phosphate oxidase family protein [Rectinemataceae bacterium]